MKVENQEVYKVKKWIMLWNEYETRYECDKLNNLTWIIFEIRIDMKMIWEIMQDIERKWTWLSNWNEVRC